MNDDDRTFLDRELAVAADMTGADPTPEEFAKQFSGLDLRTRTMKLDEFSRDMAGRTFSVAEGAKYHSYERAIRAFIRP